MPLPLRKRKGALTVSDITTEKKKLGKKTKAILIASSLLVALTICGVFISKYAKTLVTEGTVDLSTEPPALTGIPKSGDAIVQYIQKLVSGAKDNNAVSVDISTSLSVDENEITANGTDSELNIIKFAKESMLEKVTALYPSRVGTFGDGFTDYPEVAMRALEEMYLQRGKTEFDENGIMKKGMIIRHLILPSNTNSSLKILDFINEKFPNAYVSLMAQYTPCNDLSAVPELDRKITEREYNKVVDYALNLGMDKIFIQSGESADEKFIPDFDFTGIIK